MLCILVNICVGSVLLYCAIADQVQWLKHAPFLRFDSWAGMALARASRIQEKLNSNELKSDVPIWKHSQAVLNCFKRALEIDSSNLSLWIEYGTISYALHSFASRQLKQWRSELPPEVVKQVRCTLA